ncbi:hypothetical protein J1P26_10030 [Neobacillus sp. MM2021_6]|uniref:hypothetical protein n=1 Tax=Bacillaceae TaxID=186817 RepID=UPI00140C3A29|nr:MULTISPECIES: hypothetical protein [Bacillaceae]MBO0960061.1 hypothetical protein [Neobacillus sp. MM2021_6]NHC21276.1 hypothetical protein [Bacillus sp. MM2020_4]
MHYREKTIEELEDLEQKLHDQEDNNGHSNYAAKIGLYKEMVRRLQPLVRKNNKEYSHTLNYVKKKLIYNLIHYGTYLKTEYQKDDHLAAKCLEEALKYDDTNMIAAYRLGFLSYKKLQYSQAIHYFEQALTNQKYHKDHPYQLNNQQVIHAHLYLTNSAFKIAEATYAEMKLLPVAENQKIPIPEISSFFINMEENEDYLQRHAFYQVSNEGKTTCSKVECEELIQSQPANTIIIYYSDRTITAFFEGEEASLTQEQANMLRYFLIKSSEDHPVTRNAFSVVETIKQNTFIQSVNRLKHRLINCGFPPLFQTKRHQGETAYYFTGSCRFYLMYRVDEEIE